ncbi:hypothetical protein MIR68_006110 [Amoeboaphelidium protococcarum]|nr:hypothetical protein MIR68_006110 [Amoeboaphelidium protococcarum]KAI3648805.1 hypothetical protein MP228_006659 [Amoeboaphelidium protococcarum]
MISAAAVQDVKADNNQGDSPKSMCVLKQSLARYAALTQFYQMRYPHEPQIQIEHDIELIQRGYRNQELDKILIPLIHGYDERLEYQREVMKKFESQMQRVQDKMNDLQRENEELKKRQNNEVVMRKKVDILLEENTLLMENQRANELLIRKSFELEAKLKQMEKQNMVAESDAIRDLNSQLSKQKEINHDVSIQLKAEQAKAMKLSNQIQALEKQHKEVMESDQTMRESYHKMKQWFDASRNKTEEFEQCCQEMNILQWLNNYHDRHNNNEIIVDNDRLLLASIRKLKRDLALEVKESRKLKADLSDLVEAHQKLVRRYKEDFDSVDHKFNSLQSALRDALFNREEAEQAVKQLSAQNDRLQREVVHLQSQLSAVQREQRGELEEILQRHLAELNAVRSESEAIQDRLKQEVLQLKRAKTDMQTEIGWLLRDKGLTSNVDLRNNSKYLESIQRNIKKKLES